ncbi:MAG TPA: hypothetical protein VGI39_12435 [Polyangiaceae bacterium]
MMSSDPELPPQPHGVENPAPTGKSDSGTSSGSGSSSGTPVSSGGTVTVDAGARDATPDVQVDDESVLSLVTNGTFRTAKGFTEVTGAPFPTQAGITADVSEWVNLVGAKAYDQISPDETAADVSVPVGTMIVRAVLGADGGTAKLTLMFKGPPGYNPDLGDWWFGVTDPNGVPAVLDGGASEVGRLAQCYSCHIPRSGTGYLFGVSSSDRAGNDAGEP